MISFFGEIIYCSIFLYTAINYFVWLRYYRNTFTILLQYISIYWDNINHDFYERVGFAASARDAAILERSIEHNDNYRVLI